MRLLIDSCVNVEPNVDQSWSNSSLLKTLDSDCIDAALSNGTIDEIELARAGVCVP